MNSDTIAAIATAPGRGGVGIVRVSGPNVGSIAKAILGFTPRPRHAYYTDFIGNKGELIDQGIALFFSTPNSFTGEDVLELQGHGGPVILDMLVTQVIGLGARLAKPGEFSERAFLNDKLDLTQAEAIADLINASSQHAAKSALNSLKGKFSEEIDTLVQQLTRLRMYVESAIDFPEEEIDFLCDRKISTNLSQIITQTDTVLQQAQQGVRLKEGMNVVIAGRPNAGKSSLLNALAAEDVAIVTDIEGTTRDVLKQHIHIDGMPLHIIDTAGLRDNPDTVEKIGIERAWQEIKNADRILLMIDSTDSAQSAFYEHWPEFTQTPEISEKVTIIFNKIDRSKHKIMDNEGQFAQVALSAKTGEGLNALKSHLKAVIGFEGTTEGGFSARRRHITAIENAQHSLLKGQNQLLEHRAGELLAEDLRIAQNYLCEITGTFTSDDLLGEIFTSFCIGK